jgi:hypothetical protein
MELLTRDIVPLIDQLPRRFGVNFKAALASRALNPPAVSRQMG